MKKNSSRLNELDALRGIAALLVVAFHFTMGRPEAAYGFKYGICGVDLFFVISGFVIFMSLTRVKTGADFIISRASRLYPAYWAAVSFTFMLIVGRSLVLDGQIGKIGLLNYLANLTMFQFFVLIPDLDGPYWSLTIELMFYVAVLILFQKKNAQMDHPHCDRGDHFIGCDPTDFLELCPEGFLSCLRPS